MGERSSLEARSVVLVHGGFVDGSGWEGVYNILRKDGYTVAIVQNPTLSLAGAYSGDSGHPFRNIPATYSDSFRPAVPGDSGHPVGAERRWS